jgi:RNA polymerase sigma-70 factor (ECF subfamily)
MEEESFEDPGIADFLNRHYVAIKVDRERRPDIDSVYISLVQALTGSGGSPMTVWLTPGARRRPRRARRISDAQAPRRNLREGARPRRRLQEITSGIQRASSGVTACFSTEKLAAIAGAREDIVEAVVFRPAPRGNFSAPRDVFYPGSGMATEIFWATALGHMSELFNVAIALTRERSAAEDLVQETYRVALERQDQLRDLGHCRPWLFRILRNLHLDRARRERRQPQLTLIAGNEEEGGGTMDGADPTAIEKADVLDLRRALEELGEPFRLTLLLCDVHGFRYEEIAEITGSPIGTVRSRIARARLRLARLLERGSPQLSTQNSAQKEKKS